MNAQGRFVWYELMTTDTKAAETFYRNAVGWSAADSGMPGMSYTLFSFGETPVAGLMALPKEACDSGARPGWLGYVAVDDVDANAAKVKDRGGSIQRPPSDIPGVGRFAIVADPQGAVFALFNAAEDCEEARPAQEGIGHGGWSELMAAEWESAFGFYADLFGWEKGEAVDIGPMGVYQVFTQNGQQIGGMMTKPEALPLPAPCWLYYFIVDGIDAAIARVKAGGSRILNGPMEVPGGGWIVQCVDPQGAMFALYSQQR